MVHDQSAWYDAPLFVQRLLDRAATLGADIRYGLRAQALIRHGDAVTGVETGTRRWEADWVVNCTGPDADRIAALAGTELPMTRIPGLVGESTPVPGLRLDAILATPEVDLRPAPGDRICSISWPVDALLPGQSDDALAERLHAGGQRVLPALRTARLAGVRLGVRPVPADGLPLAGTHPEVPGLYHLVTHSGVNLAPELGRLAAQEIIDGDGSDLAGYRITRGVTASVQDESLTLMTTR